MEKMTLLQMTQNILSAMNSDEVSSISDTVESMQVAEEIKTTFNELFSNRDIAEFGGLINLETVLGKPNQLRIPDNVSNIKWIKYRNYRTNDIAHFESINYLTPEEFILRFVSNSEAVGDPYEEIVLLDTSPIVYRIAANRVPSYYTIFESDNVLVFDSYDSEYESNLTSSNVLAWGSMSQEFELEDDFIPPIDAHLFPHLLHEARSACFINVKEVANSKEEQRARRQLVRSQSRLNRDLNQLGSVFNGIDYSRKR